VSSIRATSRAATGILVELARQVHGRSITMSNKSEVRQAEQHLVGQLAALRDTATLRLHLLSMDARTRWSQRGKGMSTRENAANRGREWAARTTRETAHGLTRLLKELLMGRLDPSAGLLTNARSLMRTHVRTCRPNDSLTRAAQSMWETECGALPVVDDETAIGFITDRDICMATYLHDQPPSELKVSSAMSKQLFSCAPDESIEGILTTMGEERVRRLAVLNPHGTLIGIITIADIARWARSLGNPAVSTAVTEALGAISAPSPPKLQAAAE
jgi:CBS domain-containing protein